MVETIVSLEGFSNLEMELISLALRECQEIMATMSEEVALKERHISLSDLVIAKLYINWATPPPNISTIYYRVRESRDFWK